MKRNLKPSGVTRLTPIAAAVGLMVLGASFAAQAQEAVQPDSSVVVVTGVRAALAQSLNQKRNSDSLVEVVTAEDVGKMPDKSVADSLQRIPGVSVATAGGSEGGFGDNDRVSLKGTPSNLTLTTLNGHTVSSGDWYISNITGGGRSVSYTMFPSELIGRVTVHKSSQADLIEGGAAGNVNIETRKPLSFKKNLTLMGSIEGAYTESSKKTDAQISGLINWKNETNDLGILLQVFNEKRTLRRQGQEFLWWEKVDKGAAAAWIAADPSVEGKYLSFLTGSSLFEQKRQRKGGSLDVEYKVSNDLSFNVNGFYTRLDADNVNTNFMLAPYQVLSNNWTNVGGAIPSSYTVKGNTITSIAFPSKCPVADCSAMGASVQDIIARPGSYSDSKFVDFNFKYRASADLRFTGQVGTTRGTGHARDYAYEAWLAYAGNSLTMHGIDAPATVVVDNATTFNPRTGADFFSGWASDTTTRDKENYGQADGAYSTTWEAVPTIRFGVRTAKHDRSLTWLDGAVAPAAGLLANAPKGLTNYPTSPLSNVLQNGWTFSGPSMKEWGDKYVTFNKHAYQSEFQITEKANAAYVMGDLNFANVQGNFGVRYVNTKIDVANASPNDVWKPTLSSNTYNNFLPSVNLRTDLAKNVVLRGAASRTMARPDFGALGALSLNDLTMSGSGGNPNLKPIMSNNVDAGVEWYFMPKSLIAVNLYQMKLASYVTYGSSVAQFYNQTLRRVTDYNMSAAINTKARVRGVELQYTQDLSNGFGFSANYTYADGKETEAAPKSACAEDGNCDMVGTSKNSYNLSGFFENAKWSARLNYSFRSSFLNGLDRKSAIYQDDVGTVSASINYNINEFLTLSLEGKDLNDPLLKSYASTKDQPRAFYKNGRQVFFGLRGKM
ncbi:MULTISPECIES: TonB-dependent receptor [Janthinobacterium]|uniref:TonB-dependent receptor n=1 Tax=Janthinobacterium violaceinigrum TaxID=2654252 RepID=A0A6I1IHI7_9BURK|nr:MULTISPECIES: TonB-dependent receptor [Janthinobacterium]KAB8063661.1 TonB-dependent receptor [Janthinobacterium violaceinigrum]MED5598315.1 TonB-dependent receptor [Janthinobacterium sp. P210006]